MTNTTETKVTREMNFNAVKAVLAEVGGHDDLIEFCDKEIKAIQKKAETAKKNRSSANNDEIAITLKAVLAEQSEAKTITELLTDVRLQTYKDGENTVQMSTSKLTAVMTKLLNDKIVEKNVVKKRSYYKLKEVG
jgi:hypothetical protein